MVVEDEPYALTLVPARDSPKRVGRVTGVDHVEWRGKVDPPAGEGKRLAVAGSRLADVPTLACGQLVERLE